MPDKPVPFYSVVMVRGEPPHRPHLSSVRIFLYFLFPRHGGGLVPHPV